MKTTFAIDQLLSELCTELGYCSARREKEKFLDLADIGVDAISKAVLISEGLDPEIHDRQLSLVTRFVKVRFVAQA